MGEAFDEPRPSLNISLVLLSASRSLKGAVADTHFVSLVVVARRDRALCIGGRSPLGAILGALGTTSVVRTVCESVGAAVGSHSRTTFGGQKLQWTHRELVAGAVAQTVVLKAVH